MFVSCFQLGVSGGGGGGGGHSDLDPWETSHTVTSILSAQKLRFVASPMIPQISDPRGTNAAADASRLIRMC